MVQAHFTRNMFILRGFEKKSVIKIRKALHMEHAMVKDQYSDTQSISSSTYFLDSIMISHTRFLNVISMCLKLMYNTVHKVK
jgi:hypothetical protein